MQKKVIDNGSCGDYEGEVDVSLTNQGTYSGHDLRACCSKFSINRLAMIAETGLSKATPSSCP